MNNIFFEKSFAQSSYFPQQPGSYQSVQGFDSSTGETINFANKKADSLGGAINYIVTLMIVALIVIVIFRLIQGALLKGTSDVIFDHQEGTKIINNTGKILIFFILSYSILSFINPDLTYWKLVIGKLPTVPATSYTGGACPANPYSGNFDLKKMLTEDEGSKDTAYTDSTGHRTIGIGFNLDQSRAQQILTSAGITKSLQDLKSEKEKLSQSEISSLFEKTIPIATNDAKNFAGDKWSSLEERHKNVLINMAFNLGGPGFNNFSRMKDALRASDMKKTALEMIDSQWCGQVKSRCGRLAAVIHQTCGQDTLVGGTTYTPEMGKVSIEENDPIQNKLKEGEVKINNGEIPCKTYLQKNCTSLGGLPQTAVNMLIKLNKDCDPGCDVVVSGGTEWGHLSHRPGVAVVDISLSNNTLNSFIRKQNPVSTPGFCNAAYFWGSFIFCDEKPPASPHWHVYVGGGR